MSVYKEKSTVRKAYTIKISYFTSLLLSLISIMKQNLIVTVVTSNLSHSLTAKMIRLSLMITCLDFESFITYS
jgi:hypothetical protein